MSLKKKILVVEDDRAIAQVLRYNLEKEGFAVLAAADGEEGLELFKKEKPRLIILDLMLPKVDGLEVCRLVRTADRSIPILMLTAKSTEIDKIVGLEIGADDYVTKPFSVREVMTRVKTLLRRTEAPGPAAGAPLRAGALEIDVEKYEARLNRKSLELTGKEFELLKLFCSSRGRALSREDILEKVWGYDKAADIDTRTVDQHVARLRAKLGGEKNRVRTVKNIGYRFMLDS